MYDSSESKNLPRWRSLFPELLFVLSPREYLKHFERASVLAAAYPRECRARKKEKGNRNKENTNSVKGQAHKYTNVYRQQSSVAKGASRTGSLRRSPRIKAMYQIPSESKGIARRRSNHVQSKNQSLSQRRSASIAKSSPRLFLYDLTKITCQRTAETIADQMFYQTSISFCRGSAICSHSILSNDVLVRPRCGFLRGA